MWCALAVAVVSLSMVGWLRLLSVCDSDCTRELLAIAEGNDLVRHCCFPPSFSSRSFTATGYATYPYLKSKCLCICMCMYVYVCLCVTRAELAQGIPRHETCVLQTQRASSGLECASYYASPCLSSDLYVNTLSLTPHTHTHTHAHTQLTISQNSTRSCS
jgi:hypothetical protein